MSLPERTATTCVTASTRRQRLRINYRTTDKVRKWPGGHLRGPSRWHPVRRLRTTPSGRATRNVLPSPKSVQSLGLPSTSVGWSVLLLSTPILGVRRRRTRVVRGRRSDDSCRRNEEESPGAFQAPNADGGGTSLRRRLVQRASTDSQKKYRGLLKERRQYFWAVAPGARQRCDELGLFRMTD